MLEGTKTPREVCGFTLGSVCRHTFRDLKWILDSGHTSQYPMPLVRVSRQLEDVQDPTGRLTAFNLHKREQVFLDEGQESYIADLFLLAGDIRIVGHKDSFGYYPAGYGYHNQLWEFARLKFKPENDPGLSDAPEGVDTFNVPSVGMF